MSDTANCPYCGQAYKVVPKRSATCKSCKGKARVRLGRIWKKEEADEFDSHLKEYRLESVGINPETFSHAEKQLEKEWGHQPMFYDTLWCALLTAKQEVWVKANTDREYRERYHDDVLSIDRLLAEVLTIEGNDPTELLERADRAYYDAEYRRVFGRKMTDKEYKEKMSWREDIKKRNTKESAPQEKRKRKGRGWLRRLLS